MPKKRTPYQTWHNKIRPLVWKRDKGRCIRCRTKIKLEECHIDHIVSGLRGTNKIKNLRTLCRKCHILRKDSRHRIMIFKALRDKIIPVNWREYLWE